MRNGQNKRMRGRNRKSHNPLTRVYESNGPDIKIRGTANHVAEKYVQLARDAQASGDPVAAENYYQHAEHYFRMIAAVQEQFRQSQPLARFGNLGLQHFAQRRDARLVRLAKPFQSMLGREDAFAKNCRTAAESNIYALSTSLRPKLCGFRERSARCRPPVLQEA